MGRGAPDLQKIFGVDAIMFGTCRSMSIWTWTILDLYIYDVSEKDLGQESQ